MHFCEYGRARCCLKTLTWTSVIFAWLTIRTISFHHWSCIADRSEWYISETCYLLRRIIFGSNESPVEPPAGFVYELHARGVQRAWRRSAERRPKDFRSGGRSDRGRRQTGNAIFRGRRMRRRYRGQRYIVIADTLGEISAYSTWHVARASVTDCRRIAIITLGCHGWRFNNRRIVLLLRAASTQTAGCCAYRMSSVQKDAANKVSCHQMAPHRTTAGPALDNLLCEVSLRARRLAHKFMSNAWKISRSRGMKNFQTPSIPRK